MEKGNGATSSTGPLKPVPLSSDVFLKILAQLQSASLFEESKHSFRYTSAFLIRNPVLEDKYNACREKRKDQGYSEEDLKETYGFLLFDELNKAKTIGETGVLTGNGTCTTLGDPSKGVYLSMYSDCLDLNRWYHGKSGYIAIIRLTQGRVKKVSENYTQNLTEPTVGFDCHVSEQLPSVSSKTSSFLAFERTQYYMYELLDNGSNTTAKSPSLACPYAVVAFSYTDTKATLETQQEKSEEKKVACPYVPWMGKLQIGSQLFDVGIRSTAGALTRAKLPPEIKVERAISMSNLRKLLPKSIFETSFIGQVLLEDVYCSLCEIVVSSLEAKERLTPLLLEIKEKDIALTITLNDGGFLVLIHGSHFISHDNDNGITSKVLQGVFVFPESQVIQRATKIEQMKRSLPSDILRVLPLLTYAEGEVEKTSINPNEDLCDIFVHHMQSYATLISPGFPLSPFREVSIFPDQYDVPDAHRHLYSTPEWTDKQWQSLKSYLSNPTTFQLPVCKASEILAAGQEARREDLDDDIYICLSSPEEPSTSSISTEDRLDQKCHTHIEASQDSIQCAEAQPDSTTVPQKLAPKVLQSSEANSEVSDSALLTENDIKYTETSEVLHRSDEPSEELIVSITSAAQAAGDEDLSVVKHDQLSVTAKLQVATLNTFSEIVQSEKTLNSSEVNNPIVTQADKLYQGQHLGSIKTPSLQLVKTLLEKDEPVIKDRVPAQELSIHLHRCKIQTNKQETDKLSLKKAHVLDKAEDTSPTDSTLLKELETCTLRKKSERWGLKPVISTCGRILIPYGSVDTEQIKSLQVKLHPTKENLHSEEMIVDADPIEASNATDDSKNISSITCFGQSKSTEPTEENNHTKSIGQVTVNSEQNDQHSLTNGTDHLTMDEAKENHIKDTSIKCKSKGESVLRKLKSVILRKKRKKDVLKDDLSINGPLDNELSPKRAKGDSPSETLKNSSDACAQETSVDDQKVAKMLSVDPIFAHALGLTPKGSPNVKTLDLNSVQRKDLSEAQETAVAKEHPCTQKPPPSPKGARLKTLKKHQNISAEQVKKKWWLHFQTPACYAEKQYEGCSRDISVRKTVKEKKDTPAEALNLLADLALTANKEQVSPHPAPECLKEPESSLKKCDITKDVTNPEQETVLHALLRQPAAKPIQPHEPDVGGSELVDVIYREHAYSLPPSPSLLLALPAPFQVSPLNGSSRLHHPQKLWDGNQTLHPFLSPEDKAEDNKRTHGDPKKQTWYRRKFRLSRTIINKDMSVQVTRHWKEKYDFNLDSRFTVDPKDKAIVRALHGPWDFTIHDSTEEVQLIVHMWIGLFYSRSTARFFHLDPDVSFPISEDIAVLDGVDLSNEKRPEQGDSKTVLSSPLLSAADNLQPQVLDLSKPKNSVVDQESAALDLSRKLSSAEVATRNPDVSRKEFKERVPEVLNTLKPPGFYETGLSQFFWNMIPATAIATDVNFITFPANQNTGISSEINQLFIPLWNGIPNTQIWTNNLQTPSMPGIESSGSYQTEKTPLRLLKKSELLNRKRVKCQTQQSDMFLSAGPNKNEYRESKMMKVKENSSNTQDTSTDQNLTKRDMDTVSSKHVLEIKKKYMEKLKAASFAQVNQHIDTSPQNAKEIGKFNHLEKILQEDTIKGMTCQAPKPEFSEARSKTVACQEPQLNTPSSNENVLINKSAVSSKNVFTLAKALITSLEKEVTCTETATKQKSVNHIGLVPLVTAENKDSTCSEDISVGVLSNQPKAESAGQCEVMDCRPDCPNQVMNVTKEESVGENLAPQEQMDCTSLSQDEGAKIIEVTGEMNRENSGPNYAEKKYCEVVIPFIGKDTSLEDMLQPQTLDEKDKGDGVDDMEVIPSDATCPNTEVTVPIEVNNRSSDGHSQHKEQLVDEGEISHPLSCRESEPDDRCPTPTIDEQPYVYRTQPGLNYSINNLSKISQDNAEKELSRSSTPVLDETPGERAPTTLDSDSVTDISAQSDIELRTLRTLQSLDEFLSTLQYKSSQINLANNRHTFNQDISSNKSSSTPIQTSPDFKNMKKLSNTPDSCPQELQSEPENVYISPFNDVLGVMQQPKQRSPISNYPPSVPEFGLLTKIEDAALEQKHCHSTKPIFSTESLQPIKSNDDDDKRPKSNTSSSSSSQCPVVAVRPSKSDEGQGNFIPQDRQVENSVCELQPKPSIKFSIKKTRQGSFISTGTVFENQESSELCADNLVSNKCRFTSNKVKPGQPEFQKKQNAEATSSSMSTKSLKPVKSTSKHVDEYDLLRRVVDNNIGIMNNTYINRDEELLNYSTSFVDCKTNKITDDTLGTEGSLSCTVSNTKRKASSFLENVSKRCLQDDPTQSSMDRECLIFLDQMKQVFKRSKQEQQDQCDQASLPSSSPVTVRFSHLQEQDDLFDNIEVPASFVKQKFSVDMSDREVLGNSSQKESFSKPQPYGPLEHPGVSAITAECARLYRDIMNKICSEKRITSLIKDLHMTDSGDSTADSSNYFDFCSQMKREMDDSFRNSLNSVVKKSCKTKNRFFLLATSDDVFFNETKAYLEAEGHVAVHPSDFLLRESSSSPLLVIIRNEDIAEHIFEVPHLLELRKSPVVQFAGIDEPDDVVNLTYQELFIKGGFVMFDGAAVESLSPGNTKKILDILQKLNQTGKWKWVLHYRDSRRLKENARLCPDVKEKGHLLNKCKEDGLLEILPYHECDLMSREHPDYLRCLCHQQVQNISARYPLFVTDSATDSGFEKNGIVTMTVNSFLMDSLSEHLRPYMKK